MWRNAGMLADCRGRSRALFVRSPRPPRRTVCTRFERLTVVENVRACGSDKVVEFGFKRNMSEHYELGKMIGAGTFGIVHRATCREDGKEYAVKTMNKRFTGEYLERHFVERVRHEVDICNHMGNSLNVAHLYDVFEDDTCVDLVMELCTGGELWHRIRKSEYSEKEAARIVREVLHTVSQFHASNVVIRDVKPENFLFANESRHAHLKAIDFGIAQYCSRVDGWANTWQRQAVSLCSPDDTLRDRAGTPVYVAPEVLKMCYGQKADLWSAGILAYQLLSGRLPFVGDNGMLVSKLYMTKQMFSNKDVFRAILYADLDFARQPWDTISPEAKALVQSLLTRDPARRPTADEALRSPWFEILDDESGSSQDEHDGQAPLLDSVVQRLQRFGTYGRLKQIALRGIANVALNVVGDVDALRDIETTFRSMDAAGQGRVPYSAVVKYLKAGDFDLSETEVELLISQMDVTEEGFIYYDEWLAAMLEWRSLQESPEWDEWVAKAFALFDVDGTGKIGVDELTSMLCRDGVCPMPDVITAALRCCREADGDGDDLVTLDDFERLVHMSRRDSLSNFSTRRKSLAPVQR